MGEQEILGVMAESIDKLILKKLKEQLNKFEEILKMLYEDHTINLGTYQAVMRELS